MNSGLARVVRDRSAALAAIAREQQEEIPEGLHQLAREASEIALVLARILEGKPALRAFGAPGDWGYGTPLGDAVYAASVAARGECQTTAPLMHVRICNPSSDPSARFDVRTIRQDVAPGEPASLMGQLTVYPGEEVLLQLPLGAALVIAEEGTLNG